MTWPFFINVPLLKDVKSQAPNAICELRTDNGTSNLLVNRDKPPFDNADLRKAFALAIDRKAFVDILTEGQGKIGGANALRRSALSDGGLSRVTRRLLGSLLVRNSQIGSGAWALTSFSSGTLMKNGQVMSNCLAAKPRIAVERLGTMM